MALTIDGLIGEDSERLTGATGLSTVPSVLHEVRIMLEQYWPSVPHVLIEPGVRTGIPLLVDNPKEVGADRIVNCLAAYQQFAKAAIVVDFGSSICVDVVSAKGEFLGGRSHPAFRFLRMPPRPVRRHFGASSWPGRARWWVRTRWNACRLVRYSVLPGWLTAWWRGFVRTLRVFSRRRCRGGGDRAHRAAAAARTAQRRTLRRAPDPEWITAGLRAQSGGSARSAEAGALAATRRPCVRPIPVGSNL
ncbi:pantothenate kinase, type III family protein [Mycobacterium ulcerans str. Harvey]|uniref:Type III pantothenate kinase n=1 Tax=Mycobacterium ulcerans str. Harvey TaxID=1299332 RepID=A0ABN0QQ21_MYCUL|nr:pantothenate kinase, type III family protein [Mycobacterium ulcerans str. Harvey]